ncbi:MAG: glycoside hydrolase family 13 protein [Candidatus Dormibacteria bacterium]
MSKRPWWRDAVVYQVYIRSFMDSDGDGIGDLEGIRRRLPYLADLGVDAVWITPFYRSPMMDHGYDVQDYREVDPLFGDLDDFDRMLADAHAMGLRVIVDIVPNHTSDQHEWFQQAIADPFSPMRDRFIFRDPGPDGAPPNNWISVFGGPAWTREPHGSQFYLHLFAPEQPDLNWRNPAVSGEFESILKFWLDRGADGFRVDVAHGLFKDEALRDNPGRDDLTVVAGTQYHSLEEKHSWDQPEVLETYGQWRKLLDGYPGDRMLVGEVFLFDQRKVARYVGPERMHLAFNFAFAGSKFRADHLQYNVVESLRLMGDAGAPCTWVLSNHDLTRHASRLGGGSRGRARGRAVTQMLMALPGSPYLYQGEEIGSEQVDIPPDRREDPIFTRSKGAVIGRDGCRTPIPWSAETPDFGFGSGAPWLPFAPDAHARNVASQLHHRGSQLSWYRHLLHLRREIFAAADDELSWLPGDRHLMAYRRQTDGGEVLCALNTSARPRGLRMRETRLLLASKPGVTIADGLLTLPAESCAWVK